MHTSVLLQQLTHHVCIPIAAILEKNYLASSICFENLQKIQRRQRDRQTHKITSKQYTRQDNRLDIRVMVSPSTSGIKLPAFLHSPFCHPLLLPFIRWSRELLSSSGLLESSCFFFVVYPDVWLEKTTLLPRACVPDIQRNIHTGLKRETSFFLRILGSRYIGFILPRTDRGRPSWGFNTL